MVVGAMNNPFAPVLDEIRWFGEAGFDYVDLTLEPPGAWPVDAGELRAALAEHDLGIVGHTAFFLPIASPYRELREVARTLFAAACEAFEALGARLVNVHPDPVTRSYPRADVVAMNAEAIVELADVAEGHGLRLMLENLGTFGSIEHLGPILAADARVGFHFDAGHANLGGNGPQELLHAFADRLAHVHVSDNFGVDDLHLPLGAGNVPWPEVISALKQIGYDGTVTIEVFSRSYLASSAQLWRAWWAG